MSKCYLNVLLIEFVLLVVAIILLLLDGTNSLTGPVPLDYEFLRRSLIQNATKPPLNATRVNLRGIPGLPGCVEDPDACSPSDYNYRRFLQNCTFGGGSVLFDDSICDYPMNQDRHRLFCCNVFLFVNNVYDDELKHPNIYHGCRYALFGIYGVGIILCVVTLVLFYKRQTRLMRKIGLVWLLLILCLAVTLAISGINFLHVPEDNRGYWPLIFMVGGAGVVLFWTMFAVSLLKGVIQKQEYYSHPCFVSLAAWFARKAHEWSLLKFFMSDSPEKKSKKKGKQEAPEEVKEEAKEEPKQEPKGKKGKGKGKAAEEPAPEPEPIPEPSVTAEPPPPAAGGGKRGTKSKGGKPKADAPAEPAASKPAGAKPAGAKPGGAKSGGAKPKGAPKKK